MATHPGYVYVLKFSRPLGNDKHQAQYYIGWAKNFNSRLAHHRNGTGAAITKAAVEQGIELIPVVLLKGDKSLERRLKNWNCGGRVVKRYQSSAENLIAS